MVSPDLTWYTLTSHDYGFDFSTLNETLYGGMDYFYMRTSGYLASPSGTIYTAPLGTSLPKIKTEGAHRRAGWEAYLGYKNNAGDFYYDVSGKPMCRTAPNLPAQAIWRRATSNTPISTATELSTITTASGSARDKCLTLLMASMWT